MTPGHACIPLMGPPALRPCGTCQPFPGAGQPVSPGCGPHRQIRYDGSLRTQHRHHYRSFHAGIPRAFRDPAADPGPLPVRAGPPQAVTATADVSVDHTEVE